MTAVVYDGRVSARCLTGGCDVGWDEQLAETVQ